MNYKKSRKHKLPGFLFHIRLNIAVPTEVDEELCGSVVESCSRWVGTAGGPAMILGEGIFTESANWADSVKELRCPSVCHNCFGPPFLFVEGLLSTGPTPSSFYLLVEMGLPLHLFPAYML